MMSKTGQLYHEQQDNKDALICELREALESVEPFLLNDMGNGVTINEFLEKINAILAKVTL